MPASPSHRPCRAQVMRSLPAIRAGLCFEVRAAAQKNSSPLTEVAMSGTSVLLVSFVPPLCMAAGWRTASRQPRLPKCDKYQNAFPQHFCTIAESWTAMPLHNHFASILENQLQSSNTAISPARQAAPFAHAVRCLAMTRPFYAAQLGTAMMGPDVSTNVHLNMPISFGRHGLYC